MNDDNYMLVQQLEFELSNMQDELSIWRSWANKATKDFDVDKNIEAPSMFTVEEHQRTELLSILGERFKKLTEKVAALDALMNAHTKEDYEEFLKRRERILGW